MKKLKHGKVILYAAAIILVCTAALIVSIHVAFGAEESRMIAEENGNIVTVSTTGTAEAEIPSATPGAQFITKEEAIDSFMNIALNVFRLDIDQGNLTAAYNPKSDITDENGDVVYTTHDEWTVSGDNCESSIDAISGDVICFCYFDSSYNGESITLAKSKSLGLGLCGVSSDDPENSSNIYIKTAADIVNASLADGRKIDHIWIDGVQFVDDNSAGLDTDATGTIQVDCHVYMETGTSYTLSLHGTSELSLKVFYSHPTWAACSGFYYYEEDALPPE